MKSRIPEESIIGLIRRYDNKKRPAADSNGDGGESLWTQWNDHIYYDAGTVAIGSNLAGYAGLLVYYNSSVSYPHLQLWESANDFAGMNFKNTNTSNYFAIAAKPQATTADARMNFFYNASGDIMSLTGNGDVGIGTTTPANRLDVQTSHSGGYALSLYNSAGTLNSHGLRIRSGAVRSGFNASENVLIWFARGTDNAKVGSINFAGTATLFNTTSDERLKENIAAAASPSSLIDALRVRQFDWKESGVHQRYGFVAQELAEVAPEAVTQGQTEEDIWSVDNSKLVPMLVREIQELRTRVSELENR